jgi:hypothetical protein
VFIQDLVKPSIKEEVDLVVEKPLDQPLVATVPPLSTMEFSPTTLAVPPTTNADDWRVPFIKFLQDGTGYADRTENERLMRCSKQYLLVDGPNAQKCKGGSSDEVYLSRSRYLRQSRRLSDPSRQSFPSRFLLTVYRGRCREAGPPL